MIDLVLEELCRGARQIDDISATVTPTWASCRHHFTSARINKGAGMIRDLKPVWSRGSDTEISGTSASLVAVLLLALMAALAGGAALRESVTIDEVAHIGAGVSYLQKLDQRMNAEHPPCPKCSPRFR
jgi:hypothetical protein